MPPGWNQIQALLVAAAFTPSELETLCQAVFGTALSGITTATDANEQADAIVAFAVQYGLVRELTDIVLHEAARRPAVQNWLLGDDMQSDAQAAAIQNQLQMITVRLDRVLEQQSQQAAENAEMHRWRNATEDRLHRVEERLPDQRVQEERFHRIEERLPERRVQSVSTLGNAIVLFMAVAALLMLATAFYFGAAPR